jgi:hypothetical protein
MEEQFQKPMGVIDALFGGFELVFNRPWIILIPVALDLFLWLGPQVTAEPIFQRFSATVSAAQPPNASPEMIQNFSEAQKAWLATGAKFNLFSVIALVALGMPSLMGIDIPPASLWRAPLANATISNAGIFAGVIALMTLVGILIGSVYLEMIARAVRRDTGGAGVFAARAARSYLTVGVLALLAALVAFIAMLPFVFSAAVAGLFDQNVAAFLFLLGLMLLLWGALYLTFAVPAIFVSGATARQAVTRSVSVFRYNFWSAIGLIGLTYLITGGFQAIWQWITGTAGGVIAADIANAFLGSALLAALMLFYQDRITFLMRVREQLRQQQQKIQ